MRPLSSASEGRVLENVANYARHQNGDTLKRTVDMLKEEGYRVPCHLERF